MNIVFVLSEVPYPPDNGVRLVPFNIIRLMRESGHRCSIAVLADGRGGSALDLDEFARLYGIDDVLYMNLPNRNPLLVAFTALAFNRMYFMERYRNSDFRTSLEEFLTRVRPDAVHFDIITMCQYRDVVAGDVRTVASINDSYTLALDNAFRLGRYEGLRYFYRKFQRWQSWKFERCCYSGFDAVHVMSEVDRRYLQDMGCRSLIHAIPNGVDDSIFAVAAMDNDTATDVVFVANLTGENLLVLGMLLRDVWPRIHARMPQRTFRIVGKIGVHAQSLHDEYHLKNGVFFEGFVRNLPDVYRKCSFALVPIDKTCGLVNKAIEAMAAGLAVVGYESTFSGIQGAGRDVHRLAADDLPGFADAIINLAGSPSKLWDLRNAAAQFALDNFRWESRVGRFENMYFGHGGVSTGDNLS